MKKLAILFAVCMMVAMVANAEGNLDKLKAAHLNAMKYYGRAEAMNERDSKVFFMSTSKGMASVFLGENLSTGYMESGDRKIYWEITPIPGGFKIVIFINILGKTYEIPIIIKLADGELSVKVEESAQRYDWMCLLKCVGTSVLAKCLHCKLDWKCWATCAGPDVVQCVMGCF